MADIAHSTSCPNSRTSLRTVMNLIAREGLSCWSEEEKEDALPAAVRPLWAYDDSEVTLYLGSDGLILDLYKDYLDARAVYQKGLVDFGQDAPLTEIAAEHLDSAWCALQTRLYELRTDRIAAARAACLQKRDEALRDSENARLARQREQDSRIFYNTVRTARFRATQKTESAVFWWAMAWIFMIQSGFGRGSWGAVLSTPKDMRGAFNAVIAV